MIGQVFGAWVVLEHFRGTGRHYMVIAQCSCGTRRQMRADTIKSGRSASCGCRRGERIRESQTVHGGKHLHPREYASWKEMRQRCLNEGHPKYPDYGGRGISICERWRDFRFFLEDLGARPFGTTLGRIENSGDYEPGNCRWETPKQQANNTRRNIVIAHAGKAQTIAQWSDETGIKRGTLQRRYHAGKLPEQIITRRTS